MVCWRHFRQGVVIARAILRLPARFYLAQPVCCPALSTGCEGSGEQTADSPRTLPTLRNIGSGPELVRPAVTCLDQQAVQHSTVELPPITGYSCHRNPPESLPFGKPPVLA